MSVPNEQVSNVQRWTKAYDGQMRSYSGEGEWVKYDDHVLEIERVRADQRDTTFDEILNVIRDRSNAVIVGQESHFTLLLDLVRRVETLRSGAEGYDVFAAINELSNGEAGIPTHG